MNNYKNFVYIQGIIREEEIGFYYFDKEEGLNLDNLSIFSSY